MNTSERTGREAVAKGIERWNWIPIIQLIRKIRNQNFTSWQFWVKLFAYVVYGPLAYLLHLAGVKFIRIGYARIGHLAMNTDQVIKEKMLDETLGKEYALIPTRGLWGGRPKDVSNMVLVEYWKQYGNYIHIIDHPLICGLLKPFERISFICSEAARNQVQYSQVLTKWGDRPPLLSLRDEHKLKGLEILRKMGVPDGAWYVCIHAREDGYSVAYNPEYVFRNVDINTYTLAVRGIIKRGGWVIRVGDPTMKPYAPYKEVIDYVHTPFWGHEMDFFLAGSCKFLIGCNSGLHMLYNVFNTPLALTNFIPMEPISVKAKDINIIKMLYSESERRFLTFKEMFSVETNDANTISQYAKMDAKFVDNTPDEILDLVIEMLDVLEGKLAYSADDDDRQVAFKVLLGEDKLGNMHSKARLGKKFLEKYVDLLPKT